MKRATTVVSWLVMCTLCRCRCIAGRCAGLVDAVIVTFVSFIWDPPTCQNVSKEVNIKKG